MAQKSGKHESKRRPQPRAPLRPEANPEQPKGRATTLPYEERPRVPTPAPPRNAPFGSSPELITIDAVGRATLATIEEALRAEGLELAKLAAPPVAAPRSAPPSPLPRSAPAAIPEPAFVFEISTFVVEGAEVFGKASERARREFVEKRILHRLPVLSIDDVTRIDLTPGAAPNTVILRVWSRVNAASR